MSGQKNVNVPWDNCVDVTLIKYLPPTISNDRSKHFPKLIPKFSCSFNIETFLYNLLGTLTVFSLSKSNHLRHQNRCRFFRVPVIVVLALRLSVLGVSVLKILPLELSFFGVSRVSFRKCP